MSAAPKTAPASWWVLLVCFLGASGIVALLVALLTGLALSLARLVVVLAETAMAAAGWIQ